MCLPALLLRSAKEAENTDRRAWMSGNKGHNSQVCIYEGHRGRGHDHCRLLRDLCSVGLDPVGHGARVSAKQALLSSAGSKKGGRKRPRAGMTALLFILSLMGGCASAWLCKKYFEPWRRAAWADGGPRSHHAKLIAALPIIGAFFAGMLATAFILVALG